jgi:hypothetical protein
MPVPTLLLLVVAALAWLLLRRANELCSIRVTQGAVRLTRGRAPARFLSDVADIVTRARLRTGTIRVVIEAGSPRLIAGSEIGQVALQQLRNAAGQHTIVEFRTGRRAG